MGWTNRTNRMFRNNERKYLYKGGFSRPLRSSSSTRKRSIILPKERRVDKYRYYDEIPEEEYENKQYKASTEHKVSNGKVAIIVIAAILINLIIYLISELF